MTKRLQVDMSDEDYAKLRKLAKGSPLVDLVRRALSMEAFFQDGGSGRGGQGRSLGIGEPTANHTRTLRQMTSWLVESPCRIRSIELCLISMLSCKHRAPVV